MFYEGDLNRRGKKSVVCKRLDWYAIPPWVCPPCGAHPSSLARHVTIPLLSLSSRDYPLLSLSVVRHPVSGLHILNCESQTQQAVDSRRTVGGARCNPACLPSGKSSATHIRSATESNTAAHTVRSFGRPTER
jgi:hypothetical protein